MWADGPRILSRPVKLHWAGWETDTARLQQAGWQISADQRFDRDTMQIAVSHMGGARGVSEISAWRCAERYPWDERPMEASLSMRLAQQVKFEHFGAGFPSFSAVDAMPQLRECQIKTLDDLAHFAPQMVRTEQLLVPEESVDDLLSRILEKQQAAKTAYFREQMAREGAALPQHRFAAQIIAFKDAA